MGQILSEDLDTIGRIDGNGYLYDTSGNCFAKLDKSGYITKLGGVENYGRIDRDVLLRIKG